MTKGLPLLCLPLFFASCASSVKTQSDLDRMKITTRPPAKNLVFGKGLEGRMEDGVLVHKVMVAIYVTKEGKVEHAEVARSDAPMRLQWATVKAVRRFQFQPMPRPRILYQTVIYKGLKAEPG